MAQVDATRFLELLRLSRLVDEPRLETLLEQAPRGLDSAEALAQHLIDAQVLTRWQADNLLAGKHKGFRLGSYRLKGKLGRGAGSSLGSVPVSV